jgi:hypothetical protein
VVKERCETGFTRECKTEEVGRDRRMGFWKQAGSWKLEAGELGGDGGRVDR